MVTPEREGRSVVEAVTPPHNVSFPSNGRTAHGFLALPSGTTVRRQDDVPGSEGVPAVVVILPDSAVAAWDRTVELLQEHVH